MDKLKAWMEQSEQEKIAHSEKATHLHAELAELKIKWAKLQDAINSAAKREFAFMDRINNLEANLRSKTKEAAAAEEKISKMEDKFCKVMEQNCEHAKTNTDLSRAYNILKVHNERLQLKIQ